MVTNPKEDLKGITTRSGVVYQGHTIPTSSPQVVERRTEVTKDTVFPTNNGITEDVQPPDVPDENQNPVSEPVDAPVSAPMPNPKPSIPYPSRRNDEKHRENANEQKEKFYEIFKDMSFKISFVDALTLMPKFASTLKALIENKEKLSEMARTPLNEHCSAVILNKLPEKLGDPAISLFMTWYEEEADAFLALSTTNFTEVDESYYDPEGDILILEALLNSNPSPPPNQQNYLPEIRKELKLCEAKTAKSSIDEPPELPVIIAKDLSVDEKTALIKVLKSRKRAIAWKLSDIKGINPEFCSHKILMEEDYEPAVQHQRRVNPKIHDVIKKEVEKLLDAGLIYPISDSPWVSPVHCVPKKGGMTVVTNDENELVPTRLVTGWRVCIGYCKLNEATRKDHFLLPFMDQMLERLANEYYCFLDGFSGYIQIPIDPKDQEKTTFTCPYGTFAYRRMPFGLCNAPGTFQRCMMAIFHDMIEKTMEVYMDLFSFRKFFLYMSFQFRKDA
ncbi:reverse transcriptase domain-containing protein [Tanacetum coccineum]